MEPCPSCHIEIDLNARPCPNCGRPIPFSDELKKEIIKRYSEELEKHSEVWRKRFKKEEEEREMFNEQMKQETLNKNFYKAYYISRNKLNWKSDTLIKKIAEENGMSDEFEKWKKKNDLKVKFGCLIVILILVIWMIYKVWFNN